ncbi:MAG: GspH/FimT family pseudopilin [Opitutaceae bacterium]
MRLPGQPPGAVSAKGGRRVAARQLEPDGMLPCCAPRHDQLVWSRGFTLLEILLAIALMALLAGVLVTGGAEMLSDKPATPQAVFWKATQQARKVALTGEREVRLSYDAKTQAFVLDDGTGPQTLAVPPTRELTIDFLSAQPGQSSVLIGGSLVDTQTMPAVTFYPDGTCTPFRVQFRSGGGAQVLSIDPWTCAQVLTPQDSTP